MYNFLSSPITFGRSFVPRLVNNIFIYIFQFLPFHSYDFWYNNVSFSVVVIVKLGSREYLDMRITKDCFKNTALCYCLL